MSRSCVVKVSVSQISFKYLIYLSLVRKVFQLVLGTGNIIITNHLCLYYFKSIIVYYTFFHIANSTIGSLLSVLSKKTGTILTFGFEFPNMWKCHCLLLCHNLSVSTQFKCMKKGKYMNVKFICFEWSLKLIVKYLVGV